MRSKLILVGMVLASVQVSAGCKPKSTAAGGTSAIADRNDSPKSPRLGARVQQCAKNDGLEVTEVVAGTPAAAAGLKPGMRIVALNGQVIRTEEDYAAFVDAAPTCSAVAVMYTTVCESRDNPPDIQVTLDGDCSRPETVDRISPEMHAQGILTHVNSRMSDQCRVELESVTPAAGNAYTAALRIVSDSGNQVQARLATETSRSVLTEAAYWDRDIGSILRSRWSAQMPWIEDCLFAIR